MKIMVMLSWSSSPVHQWRIYLLIFPFQSVRRAWRQTNSMHLYYPPEAFQSFTTRRQVSAMTSSLGWRGLVLSCIKINVEYRTLHHTYLQYWREKNAESKLMKRWISIMNTTVKESHSPKQVSKHMVTHSMSLNRKSANGKLMMQRHI